MTYGVITATLNVGATLPRCIDSVLAQEPLPAHYVFVDGGSTDATRSQIAAARERVAAAGLPTRIELQEQQRPDGIFGAFNQGIAALDTDLVFILNGDDWYAPHAAARVLAAFAADPSAGIVAAGIDLYQTADDPAPRRMLPRSPWLFPVLMPVMHPACFVRRAVYQNQGLYDTSLRYSADYDWCYRCHSAGVPVRRLPDVLTHMLAGGAALSHRDQARRETRDAGRRHCPIPGLPDLAYHLRRLSGR